MNTTASVSSDQQRKADWFWPVMAVLTLIYLAIAGCMVASVPPLSADEMNGIVGARSFIHGHGYNNFLVEDIVPIEALPFLKETASVGRPLYLVWFGTWMSIFPAGWISARVASVIAGALFILFMGCAIRRTLGDLTGILSAGLILLQPSFWITCNVVNELILTALGAMVVILLLATNAVSKEWGLLAFGISLFFLPLIHPFGAVIACGVACIAVAARREAFRNRIGLLGVGLLAGILVLLIGEPWRIQQQNPIYMFFSRPPVFRHLSPLEWLSHLKDFFISDTSFYYPGAEKMVWGLKESFLGMWVVLGTAITSIAFFKPEAQFRHWVRGLVAALTLTVVIFVLIIARLEGAYFVLSIPFAVPIVAVAIKNLAMARSWLARILLVILVVGSVFSAVSFGVFVRHYRTTYRSHVQIVHELTTLMGSHADRIMAPSIFFFDFPDSDFRDLSVLNNAYYFTEGRFEPADWLKNWHPDIIVANSSFLKFLNRFGDPATVLARLLPVRVEDNGEVETGTVEGTLRVFCLHWA